ncbi:choice-of-anchor I family protein [Demequina gelatinilytica]|uniref:choice-of-anchor I family protein n=1 Tax=Demequina gelatinilytica TaxID=1638980 RepID=UPI000781AA5A|nr:choice-of-anchor I family protein [Demequina gelatinilytica]
MKLLLAACAATALAAAAAAPATAAIVSGPTTFSADGAALTVSPLGTYETGVFDASAAEIVAFHARSQQLYSVDANVGEVNVLDASDPAAPSLVGTLAVAGIVDASGDMIPAGSEANSVAVREDGLVVVAVEAAAKTDRGWLAFFDTDGDALGAVRVGAQPDMVTVTPDGRMAISADEGEPDPTYTVDPEGTVSIVTLPRKVAAPTQAAVRTADFHAYEGDALPDGVRVFGPTSKDGLAYPVSRNLEPEYVTVDSRSRTAYVTLQEANAIAVVDLRAATVADLWSLGAKDLSVAGNGIDPSDKDDAIAIRPVPLKSLYMPDSIAAYTSRGITYLVTANEGDARDDWNEGPDGYEESIRIADLADDGLLCDGVLTDDQLKKGALGRLDVSTASGYNEDLGCFDELYAFGGRSFSIWTTDGTQVFDSGDDLEQITAEALPDYFNSSNDETELDSRSDAKGPEPEGVTVGEVRGRTYAFVGLERIGGVMVYDVTSPACAEFVTYVNNRDFEADPESSAAGDLGPEGLAFIAAKDSPTRSPMLAVGNEVSGTTTLYSVDTVTVDRPAKGKGRPTQHR